MRRQASRTSASSYCRSTFIARITAGSDRGVGTSNPPSANDTRESAANDVAPAATSAS